MQYSDIEDILFNNKPLQVPEETKRRIAESHAFLKEFGLWWKKHEARVFEEPEA